MKKLKLRVLILVLILSFLIFIIFLKSSKDYTKEYEIDKIAIKESYKKDSNAYEFTFKYKDTELSYLIEEKYKNDRGLVNKIKIIEKEEAFCLLIKSDKFKFQPLCSESKKQVHYTLVNKELKEKFPKEYQLKEKDAETIYNDIKIYNADNVYLIWNYDGFHYLNGNTKKEIKLFKKESYKVSLVGYTDDYLVVADYDANYTFNKVYTIKLKDGELKEYEIDRDIYFDSYFIGSVKNKIYIVDNKEKVMYEFNAKNGEIEKIKSKILVQGEWM